MGQTDTVVKPEAAGAPTGTTPAEVAAATPAPARVDMELPDNGWNGEISDDDFAAEDAKLKPGDVPKPDATDDEDDDDDDEIDEQASEAEKPTDGTEAATVAAEDAAKPKGKEARIAQLKAQIAELEKPDTTEPNADIRATVARKNLAEEQSALDNEAMTQSQIRSAGLELEQKLLDQTNPETGEAYTPDEANLMARRATLQATRVVESQKAFSDGVKHNQTVINTETQRAMAEFPIFVEKLPDGTPNPAYDEAAANLAGNQLMDAYVFVDTGKKDKDGQPITVVGNIKRSPYEILKSVADQAAKYKSQAEATARTAADEQSANADLPAFGNTAATKKGDPAGKDFDDAFDEMD